MRSLKKIEFELISKLTKGKIRIPNKVVDMNDGNMGSISFDLEKKNRRYRQIAAGEFYDSDGVLVDFELTIDKNKQLFEFDFWKVDFSPLKEYPTIEKIRLKNNT
jgi:hypothetical protein